MICGNRQRLEPSEHCGHLGNCGLKLPSWLYGADDSRTVRVDDCCDLGIALDDEIDHEAIYGWGGQG